MIQKLKERSLLALLCDGKRLQEFDAAAISLYNLQRGPIDISQSPSSISELPKEKELTIGLSLLDFALQRKDEALIERATKIADKFGVENTAQAVLLLKAAVGSEIAMIDALKRYFDTPDIIKQVQGLLYPTNLIKIANVNPNEYRHPDDVAETQKLKQRQGFESLARYLSKHIAERAQAIQNAGNAIAVGPNQYPDLFRRYQRVAERLGVHPLPPLYLSRGDINAYTSGVEEPFVSLSQGAFNTLKPSELDFVLGHELGHVHFDHVLFQLIARMGMAQGFILSPSILLGRLISSGMAINIAKWARKAELSCDRAGLLACQNEQAAISTLLRFAGAPANRLEDLNLDAFLAQHAELDKATEGALGAALSGLDKSHPWITQRVKSLRDWIQSGEYAAILEKGIELNPVTKKDTPAIEQLRSALSWSGSDPMLAGKMATTATNSKCKHWKTLLGIKKKDLPPIESLRKQHETAMGLIEKDLAEGISKVKTSYRIWFKKMSEEDRRHVAPKRLSESLETLIQNSLDAHLKRLPQSRRRGLSSELRLKSKSDDISPTSLAAGIGQLGYGALLIPAAPVWMLVAGVSIGAASAAANKKQRLKTEESKRVMHCNQVDSWLEANRGQIITFIEEIGENHLKRLQQFDEKGWQKSISEIRMQFKAHKATMG